MIRDNFISFYIAAIAMLFMACGDQLATQHSKTKALSSNDWFKDGVDRFYLAYMDTETRISSGHPEKYGHQFFFGVGCYGESPDPKALLSVPVAPGSRITKQIPLNERTMLHEFPVVFDQSSP